jgi:peroxiredoxin
MNLKIGDKAPQFTLINTSKEEVSLSDYEGKNLLILFFPLAFTSVCTAELCGIRDNLKIYENAGVDVIGISVDSLFTLDQFKSVENLNFSLLSDFNKEVSRIYGSIYEDFAFGMKGVSKRSAFVIDKNGIIRYAEVLESAGDLPNFAEIEKIIKKL